VHDYNEREQLKDKNQGYNGNISRL